MLDLRDVTPQEWSGVRAMYRAYATEIGPFGKRQTTHFDLYARTPGHAIKVLTWENTIVGFAFLRWKGIDGTELVEYYVDPAFRGLDIAFLGFKLLSETYPGRWQGIARVEGKIAAFWKWSIRRLKGSLLRSEQIGNQFIFSFYTNGTAP